MKNTPNDASRHRLQRTPSPRDASPHRLFGFASLLSDARRALPLRIRAALLPTLVILGPLLIVEAAASHAAQTGTQMAPGVPPRQQQGLDAPADPDPLSHSMEEQMMIKRTTERQKVIVADTTRLLQLATELKTEVDKSNKDQLSISVVKKAEEVEKLARAVKEKMKGF
jgi:hypothetical protein